MGKAMMLWDGVVRVQQCNYWRAIGILSTSKLTVDNFLRQELISIEKIKKALDHVLCSAIDRVGLSGTVSCTGHLQFGWKETGSSSRGWSCLSTWSATWLEQLGLLLPQEKSHCLWPCQVCFVRTEMEESCSHPSHLSLTRFELEHAQWKIL